MTPTRTDGFVPLRSYALLGDLRATALVASDGAVDWLAAPALDSPPLCAALLDPSGGGHVTLAPAVPYEVTRRYAEGTMVLETTFTTRDGVVRVTDALNLGALGRLPWTELARVVTVESGRVPMEWRVAPGHRLDARSSPWARGERGVPLLTVGDQQLAVVTEGLGEPVADGRAVHGRAELEAGTTALLALVATDTEPVHVPAPGDVRLRVERTTAAWRQWSGTVRYDGRWRAAVLRSALTLKALTSSATGAIAGAATTSLPERIGGPLNYDYRFAWIRDGSYALDALSRLGLSEELHAGVSWLLDAVAHEAPGLRPLYALSGRPVSGGMTEVSWAPGYRDSAPVHVGNAAAAQLQLGSYGDLFDAVHRYCARGGHLDGATNTLLGGMTDRVCDLWRSPDSGFWELGERRQYTSSKLGCWTALDRAVRLAESGRMSSPHVPRWRQERDAVRDWIDRCCWSEAKQSYTFYAGTDELDAATLLAARTGFCAGNDPRLSATVRAVRAELGAGGCLLYRYSGQREKEGAFLACSGWLVEALHRTGRTEEAAELLDDFTARANDVGLCTEQTDPATGALLGNFPQALTHLAVIAAATALSAP
ncbi:glycoside hydrolase family 15 protein [Streptomyces sp. NRRL B-12105]|uniref:glycoside hydrolase family 15 protein n=1 Tax=Streptomyces sp. NRRL B-12105 TaxID=1463827 RepID=UPI0004BFB0D3|nr:glycoside hydrolase family 15 protein [Streptomyces sp. NRRL B-12105]